jgi:Thioredoxin like C-terminal domain
MRTPETYLGYGRSERFASPGGAGFDERRAYELPGRLRLNHWALAGEWTIGREQVVLDQAGGTIAYRFHTRDAHLVLSPGAGEPIPFRVLLDGEAPGPSHGADVDEDGNGVLADGRPYQRCASPTRSASGPWRSRSWSPAPRHTCSPSGSGAAMRPSPTAGRR